MSLPDDERAARRTAGVIFLTLFFAYGYFHQGGGWNQNVRFDQVRSVVEEGTWWINRYCAYEARTAGGRSGLKRAPLPENAGEEDLGRINSWDVSLYEGRLYPNKPPGTTLLAAPAHALIWRLERSAGVDPDDWLGLTASLYVTTVLSVGLAGAAGGVIFFYVCRRLFPDLEVSRHAAATLAFALGTIVFPFATMLFDHVPVATASLAGFALVLAAGAAPPGRAADARLFAAGAVLGFAVVLNYTSVVVVALLTLYLARRLRPRRRLAVFLAGGAPPAAFLAWYHAAAFGSPLANANTHQLDRYHGGETLLFSMFGMPDPDALWRLLFSDFRGLFVFSPILLLAFYGLWAMLRHRRQGPEAVLIAAVFGAYLLLNASFNNWHAGATFGPRYLIPALPFLALPLALAFARLPKATAAVAAVSVAINFLGTATAPLIHFSVEHPLLEPMLFGFLGRLPLDPVARGAQGVYELGRHTFFGPESFAARWNSFNLGEALFPQSRWSLLPLLLILVLGAALALRRRLSEGSDRLLDSPTHTGSAHRAEPGA